MSPFLEHTSSSILREKLCSKQIMKALTALVRTSKFSILQNEGIIALTLLFTYVTNAEATEPIENGKDSFLPNFEDAAELAINLCVFFKLWWSSLHRKSH